MPNFNYAFTAPINPPSATPVLTTAQIWTGLQRKIRFAHEFVPAIESCEVLSDKDGVVTREVKFSKGIVLGKDHDKEVVTGFEPSWVEFVQEEGTTVRNIISNGDNGLYMTYTFQMRRSNLEEGEASEKELAHLKALAKNAVESTIKTIREMVKDGRIKA